MPGYADTPLKGTIATGNDLYIIEPSLESVKLNFKSTIKTEEGEYVFFGFNGVIKGNERTRPVMKGQHPTPAEGESMAVAADWGDVFVSARFETGSKKWKDVMRKVFVGSERLVCGEGNPIVVEINLSEVCVLS